MQWKNKNLLWCIVLAVCVFLVTIFIFSNSLADSETSHEISGKFIDFLFLRKLLDNQIVQLVVRKAAHMVEFFLLGSCVMGFALKLRSCYQKSLFGFSFFYVLSVAVVDEFIQTFSEGRTASVADVLLDFLGAILGFGIVFLIHFFLSRRKKSPC